MQGCLLALERGFLRKNRTHVCKSQVSSPLNLRVSTPQRDLHNSKKGTFDASLGPFLLGLWLRAGRPGKRQRPIPMAPLSSTALGDAFWQEAMSFVGFPGVTRIKNPPANAGDIRDMGSVPGLGRSPGEGHGNPLHYSCLGRHGHRSLWAMAHGVSQVGRD